LQPKHAGAVKPTTKLTGYKLVRFLNRIHGQQWPLNVDGLAQ